MNNKKKAELLKPTITQLYSKEGRSKVYISNLLDINRKVLSDKIKEWNLPEAEPRHHLTPSNQKFLNKHRNLIKARLDDDISITKIAKELNVSRGLLQKTIIPYDPVLNKAREDYINRIKQNAIIRKEELIKNSSHEYIIKDLPGEIWKPILGYTGYMVSNKGRIKNLAKRYNTHYLVQSYPNKNNGRLYVMLYNNNKKHNIQVANLVAHAFVSGYDEKHCTVNHNDGNVANNDATNLEWTTQAKNNLNAYRTLNRSKVNKRKYKFKKIIYKNQYEFSTVTAFAKFLNKSETQTSRYLDKPEEHNIKFIR